TFVSGCDRIMAPRQSADRRESTAPPAAPLVRDFGRQAVRVPVRWDVRSAYDFLFSLSDDAGSTDDLPGEDRAWLTKSKDALRSQVGDQLDLYASEFCILLAGLAVDRPDVTDAAAFLRLLNQTSVSEIVALIVRTYFRDPA